MLGAHEEKPALAGFFMACPYREYKKTHRITTVGF
jgi:hypothetical protein